MSSRESSDECAESIGRGDARTDGGKDVDGTGLGPDPCIAMKGEYQCEGVTGHDGPHYALGGGIEWAGESEPNEPGDDSATDDSTDTEQELIHRLAHRRIDAVDGLYSVRSDFVYVDSDDDAYEDMSVGAGGNTHGTITIDVSYDTDDRHVGVLAELTPEKARQLGQALIDCADYEGGEVTH